MERAGAESQEKNGEGWGVRIVMDFMTHLIWWALVASLDFAGSVLPAGHPNVVCYAWRGIFGSSFLASRVLCY